VGKHFFQNIQPHLLHITCDLNYGVIEMS